MGPSRLSSGRLWYLDGGLGVENGSRKVIVELLLGLDKGEVALSSDPHLLGPLLGPDKELNDRETDSVLGRP